LALLEQGSAVDGMALSFGQTQNEEEAMPVVTVLTVDVSDSVIDQLNNERRQEKKQRDQEALVISQDVTKIPEVTDMLTSEQDLSQSYKTSSESIGSAYCVLSS
ncbi:6220_t:CDS:2, partial [Dentiscutata erythropus]